MKSFEFAKFSTVRSFKLSILNTAILIDKNFKTLTTLVLHYLILNKKLITISIFKKLKLKIVRNRSIS